MGKQPAILKKLNSIIKDADTLKSKKNYAEAVRKYREGINFLRLKATGMEGREERVSKIMGMINQTHSTEIDDVLGQGRNLASAKKFTEAMEKYNYAMEITDRIDEYTLKDSEQSKVKFEINKKDLKILIEEGKKIKEEKDLDSSLDIFQKALNNANELFNSDPRNNEIADIKDLINLTYSEKIKKVVDIGNDYKSSGKLEEAIKNYGNALKLSEKMFDTQSKEVEVANLKNSINQMYSEKLNPLLEKGKSLIEEDKKEEAVKELKNAENAARKMFESNQKNDAIQNIGKYVNPLYIEMMIPIKSKGMDIINEERYQVSTPTVIEAASTFNEVLKIVDQMIDSEEKDRELNEISKLINNTCSAGIEIRENNGLQLIDNKKYEDAISEMYSALSIAKNMASEEDQNKELKIIKSYINKVYSAEIEDVLENGKELLNEKKHDEARDAFNIAMRISNKMYVSDEMEEEIGTIKSLLYQAEMKGVVATGITSEKQKKYEQELEDLKKELDRANIITDAERRRKKIEDVKHDIDIVYSNLIKLVIEEGNLQAEQNKFDDAGKEIENALKLTQVIEYSPVRDGELKNIIIAVCTYGNLLAKQKNFENAYKQYDRALEITDNIKDGGIKIEEIRKIKLLYEKELDNKAKQDIENGKLDEAIKFCQKAIDLDNSYVESYFNMGKAYTNKKEYDKAIEYYEKAVNLDSDHINAWSDMGLAYELKMDFDNALKSLDKAIGIDSKFALVWYRKGNVYKHKKQLEEAIESYKKATKLDPDMPEAWLFMGSIFFDNKEYDRAIEFIDKAIELNSEISMEISSVITDFKNIEKTIVVKLTDLFKNK